MILLNKVTEIKMTEMPLKMADNATSKNIILLLM